MQSFQISVKVNYQCFSVMLVKEITIESLLMLYIMKNYSPSLGDLFPLIMVYLSKLVSFFPSWQGQKHLAHCKSGMSISTKQLWSSKMNFSSTTTYILRTHETETYQYILELALITDLVTRPIGTR